MQFYLAPMEGLTGYVYRMLTTNIFRRRTVISRRLLQIKK